MPGFARRFGRLLALAPAAALVMSAARASSETETLSFRGRKLEFRGATRASEERNVVALKLHTDRGDIDARFHPATGGTSAAKQFGVV